LYFVLNIPPATTVVLLAALTQGCQQPVKELPASQPEKPRVNRTLQLVSELPRSARWHTLDTRLPGILREMGRATQQDTTQLRRAIRMLSHQPQAPAAIYTYYQQLDKTDFLQRFQAVQLLGSLGVTAIVRQLNSIIWTPLPAAAVSDGLSARDREEMIISTAVEQLAGVSRKGVDQLLMTIIRGHESVVVRMAAINAYLRRHQRDPGAQSSLKRQLPSTLHPLLERSEIGTDTTRGQVDP
jgi:hypothetical protein